MRTAFWHATISAPNKRRTSPRGHKTNADILRTICAFFSSDLKFHAIPPILAFAMHCDQAAVWLCMHIYIC